nr:ABC transporter permease [Chelativorans xinjiangense]
MKKILDNPSVALGLVIVVIMAVPALFAPLVSSIDPTAMAPMERIKPPSASHWFGTDLFGRDVYSRVVHGGRTSLLVGLTVAAISIVIGMVIGAASGYIRVIDAVVMRIMDGLMAIPSLLLAIAMVSVGGASLTSVVVAITLPEIPRVVRLVRGIVLTIREEAYVEAAVTAGTSTVAILWRHILPNTIAALIVLASYIGASAVLTEASLGFLGAGISPEIPSWGNIIAEARVSFQIAPWILFFPSACLVLIVLGVNVLGDGLRDTLDPRLAKKM